MEKREDGTAGQAGARIQMRGAGDSGRRASCEVGEKWLGQDVFPGMGWQDWLMGWIQASEEREESRMSPRFWLE